MDLPPAFVTTAASALSRSGLRRITSRRPARWVLPLAGTVLSLCLGSHLRAQSAAPFSSLGFGVSAAANVNREGLHELWHPGHGVLLRVSMPFYLGSAAVSAQLAAFRSREKAQPDFRAITTSAEWNADLPVSRRLGAFVGVQVGVMDMTFLRPNAHAENPQENELLFGGQAGVSARLAGRVGVSLMASHRRVFTHVPIDLTYASAGLEYHHPTPPWLREFLQ